MASNSFNNKEKGTKKDIILTVAMSVGIIAICVSGFFIVKILLDYRAGKEIYDSLRENVFKEEDFLKHSDTQRFGEKGDSDGESKTDEDSWSPEMVVCRSVARLQKEVNPDVVGWIEFDNKEIGISYPIMKGEDDNEYLKTTYAGDSNSAGSIFMEAANTADFQDFHTIIYGHNMKNGTMFGKLKKYREEDFYEENQYFTVYTADEVYRYRIFAYYDVPADGRVYDIYFESGNERQELIYYMIQESYLDSDILPAITDKIMTLSTCTTTGNRFVINAVRVGEQSVE